MRVHERTHEGIDPADYATTVDVLRRIVANMGGNGNLPDRCVLMTLRQSRQRR